MDKPSEFQLPEVGDLEAFFRVEPCECSLEDGYWAFEVLCDENYCLRFSMDVFERSVQTELRLGLKSIVIVSHEFADRLWIRDSVLGCDFRGSDFSATLRIDRDKGFSAVWSTLRTR